MIAGAVALVVVATTFPFQPRTDPAWVADKLADIDWRLVTGRVDYDLVQNLLLMVPLGVALACTGRVRRPRHVAVEAALVAAALSVGVEALQVFLPGRYPQLPDVLANVCGCFGASAVSAGLRGMHAHENRTA